MKPPGQLTEPVVFVVEDDASVREALSSLIRSVGLRAEMFSSAQAFLKHQRPDAAACLVLDVRLPGLSGLDLQRELAARGNAIPVIFITGHGDIPMSVRAMKDGAVEFLTKQTIFASHASSKATAPTVMNWSGAFARNSPQLPPKVR